MCQTGRKQGEERRSVARFGRMGISNVGRKRRFNEGGAMDNFRLKVGMRSGQTPQEALRNNYEYCGRLGHIETHGGVGGHVRFPKFLLNCDPTMDALNG